ncbi:LOW QUALITY PROTEIN: cilia- and flagella-associated protein 36 [Aplochiton taeniatus]
MAEEDSEWVVESIAGYLGSPEWVIPVTDFMENKYSFDDEDENKLTHTEIHHQYKNLVEKLLENTCRRFCINEQQFLDACLLPFAKSQTLQTVFQPVLATDDFQMCSLMVQKNMELQLQALRVIKEKNGALPECLTDGVDVMSELEQQEMRILQEVLKRSKEEYDQEMSRRLLLEEEIGSTSSSSTDRPIQEGGGAQPATPVPAQLNSTKTKAVGHGGSSTGASPLVNGSSTTVNSSLARVLPAVRAPVKGGEPPVSPNPQTSNSQAAEGWVEEARVEAGISKPYTELSVAQQEQLQQRALYLCQQRDKLQALKKEQQRPKPQPAISEELPAIPTPTTPEISVEERKKLQKRKHLAEKLKEEVIKK